MWCWSVAFTIMSSSSKATLSTASKAVQAAPAVGRLIATTIPLRRNHRDDVLDVVGVIVFSAHADDDAVRYEGGERVDLALDHDLPIGLREPDGIGIGDVETGSPAARMRMFMLRAPGISEMRANRCSTR